MKDPEGEKERDLLQRLRPALESGQALRSLPMTAAEEKLIRSFAFLTLKPLLHFINIDEKDLASIRRPEALFPGLGRPGHVPGYMSPPGPDAGSWPSAAASRPTWPSSTPPSARASWPSTGWPR